MAKGLRLYKKEKLCSEIAIGRLFSRSADVSSAVAYPLRAVWRQNASRKSDAPLAFVISVPKKRLRHAVDRVAMRRRIREAYRLSRHTVDMPEGSRLDVAFLYLSDKLKPYAEVEAAVVALLDKIRKSRES